MSHSPVMPHVLDALKHFDSCTLSNAIEELNLRPRNEGFIQRDTACMFRRLPPIAGFAVTARMRAATPPIEGRCYYDHIEWWRYLQTVPAPRIVVALDIDDPPGAGALFGEMHARICMALHCLGYITNGAVRDLPPIERAGFQLFAGSVSVSHSYAHVVDYGQPIEIGGLRIQSGDLLHADMHGVLSVPQEAAPRLPGIAARILRDEHALVETCLDGDFSIERLADRIREHTEKQICQ